MKSLSATLIILLCIIMTASAQEPSWQWAEKVAGNGASTDVDYTGNIYQAGTYEGNLSFGNYQLQATAGNRNVFIVKYNSIGQLLWLKDGGTLGNITSGNSGSYEGVGSIKISPLGNIYINGECAGTSAFGTLPLSYSASSFIAKYTINGDLIWSRVAMPGGNIGVSLGGSNIPVDSAEQVVQVGEFAGAPIIFGNDTLESPGYDRHPFIVKYDANGNALWARTAKGSGGFYNIATDMAGNSYVEGNTQDSTMDFGNNMTTGDTAIYLAKYSANGQVQWVKSYFGADRIFPAALAVDPSGSIYQTGYARFDVEIGPIHVPKTNDIAYLAKYDNTGTITWLKGMGNTSGSIAIGMGGQVYYTSSYYDSVVLGNITFRSSRQNANKPFFLASVTPGGNINWAKNVPSKRQFMIGGGMEQMGVCLNKFDEIYLSGTFVDTIICGNTTLTDNSTLRRGAFLAKLSNAPNSVPQVIGAADDVSLYPNPSTGIYTISMIAGDYQNVVISDQMGKTVYHEQLTATTTHFDLTHLPAGIYFACFAGRSGMAMRKIVVQH